MEVFTFLYLFTREMVNIIWTIYLSAVHNVCIYCSFIGGIVFPGVSKYLWSIFCCSISLLYPLNFPFVRAISFYSQKLLALHYYWNTKQTSETVFYDIGYIVCSIHYWLYEFCMSVIANEYNVVCLPESVGEADVTNGGMKQPCVQGGGRDGHCLLSNVQRVVRTICRGACV